MRKRLDGLILKFQVAIGYRKKIELKDKVVYLTKKEIATILIQERARRMTTKQVKQLPKRKKKYGY